MLKKTKEIIMIFLAFSLLFIGNVFADSYYYNASWHTHDENISLYINNKLFEADVPPLIINGRTIVPARTFFEALGANVSWDEKNRLVTIEKEDYIIKVTIDSTVAFVNGKSALLDVPPVIITDKNGIARTMIPARFISSWLGYGVTWDGEKKTVGINTPKQSNVNDSIINKNQITKIETTCTDKTDTISIYYTLKTEPKIMKLSDPSRLVIDFYDSNSQLKGSGLNQGGACYTNIRYAAHDDYTRIVIDIAYDYKYTVNTDEKKCTVNLTKTGTALINNTEAANNNTPKSDIKNNNIGSDIKKIVVIDPGHGGSDPGAIGKFNDEELRESDVTLDISLKLKKILENNGIKVSMTRTSDKFVELTERANYANNLNAALFVCVHINAATIEGAHGSEVYYYTGDSDAETKDKYGVTSKEFAKNILDGVISHAKRYNRGISDGSRFVVMHRTIMPAILVECAFITNEEECELLKTDLFKQKLAEGIAEGVIKTLNDMDMIK